MLSRTTEYAMRALICLAEEQGKSRTAESLSSLTKVPIAYLPKVLQILTKGGLISSQRGVSGGFTLTRSPAELTLLDIVQCVDPMTRIVVCPLNIPGHTHLCRLHRKIDDAMQVTETYLQQTTLAELVEKGGDLPPLCSVPTDG